MQSAQLLAIKAVRPEYRDIHSQVLQDVLTQLDRAFQRFLARVKAGQTPGYPRIQGQNRYTSFTYKQSGNGAILEGSDNGFLVVSKIGRIAVRWSRPMEETIKTVTISREADGWYVRFSCADVPVQPMPATGRETGIDLGIEAFAILSNGTRIFSPRLVQESRTGAEDSPTARLTPQEGEQPPQESGCAAGQSPSDGAPPAPGRSPQDGARFSASERHRVSRGPAGPQHGPEPPPGQEYQRCGLGSVLEHPFLQGGMRRSESASGQSCVHQPSVFWLWRAGRQGPSRPLA
jgi:hypothetical protein